MKDSSFERRKKRVRFKVYGKTARPRLSVSRSNKNIYVQIIDDDKRKTLIGLSLKGIKDQVKGKTKLVAAGILGEEIALRAKKIKIKKIVFDRGGYRYLGRVKAVAEGARKGGLDF